MATIPEVKINSPFRLILDTDASLSGGSSPRIHYRKPEGTTGVVNGTVDSSELIYYDFPGATIDTAGIWSFESGYTFSGDTAESRGQVASILVTNLFQSSV